MYYHSLRPLKLLLCIDFRLVIVYPPGRTVMQSPRKRRRQTGIDPPSAAPNQIIFRKLAADLLCVVVPVARYGSDRTNIFWRMQNTDIPKEEEDPYLFIPSRLPPPDDFLLDFNDQRYLQLFLERGRVMIRPLGFFFPTACEKMFKTSLDYTRLRHAIIAIAMHYSDRTSTRHCPNPRLDQYLDSFSPNSNCPTTNALVRISDPSISAEGEIFALFLVLTITLVRLSETKDVESLRRHVNRLYNLFKTAQAEVSDGRRERLSPLLFSIWRQVMRINVTFALGVTHFPAIFPPPACHPGGRPAQGHGPIRQYLGSASREFEAWTLASLELDDLGNRIFRLHLRASAVRSAKPPDPIDEKALVLNTQQFVHENEQWKQKPVIQVAEYMEQLHRQQLAPAPPPEKSFLGYPSIRFKNPLYACLLLTHYALTISLSLIVDPRVGPRTKDRIDAAVEICRIYASLGGNHPVGSLTCLAAVWWAGLVFDARKYPFGTFPWKCG
jgi:hypothetical protein